PAGFSGGQLDNMQFVMGGQSHWIKQPSKRLVKRRSSVGEWLGRFEMIYLLSARPLGGGQFEVKIIASGSRSVMQARGEAVYRGSPGGAFALVGAEQVLVNSSRGGNALDVRPLNLFGAPPATITVTAESH